MYQDIHNRLRDIKERLDAGEASPTPTVREFLSWVSAQRRGMYIVAELRDHLRDASLDTYPDFETVHIDTAISFVTRGAVGRPRTDLRKESDVPESGTATSMQPPDDHSVVDDPRNLVSRLASANRRPMSIAPNTPRAVLVTKMLIHDYSQLPVMTGERDVKGVVSWKSIARSLESDKKADEAKDLMEPARILFHSDSLLTAMREVSAHEYVLVRGRDHSICGIVTTTDIGEQFLQLTEPFLLLGEIEQSLRGLLGRLPKESLQQALNPEDSSRVVERPADLTFGEYIRVLEKPGLWSELEIRLDRNEFVRNLESVRRTRNDIMHFDPDGITDESRLELRNLVKLLDWLRS